ncbi:helix-turn-helix domain-containing protein [Pseudomonas capeferrum]|uniref:helix-turn-helix domain-containing protein n=1 Tax=Pseudomonas capeferrum TaxID=1495066 RepID=UPI0004D91F22|nr:helix-turn-helix transcriptional regulator [Pseudomonas capeferrum]KEY87629.1 regulatory protein [Pseudomonas capeferrum]MCH7302116.1 helix-turn-helix domain-containing protein [Pseudomonas capeferrum]
MGIGERLKEERERLGLNQTEFAALAGASKNTQYNYEKGERSPDANYLAAAAHQGVDILYVITGQRLPSPETSLAAGEAEILRQIRSLDTEDRAAVERLLAAFNR